MRRNSALGLLALPLLVQAAEPPAQLERVEVVGHYQLGLGQSSTAS